MVYFTCFDFWLELIRLLNRFNFQINLFFEKKKFDFFTQTSIDFVTHSMLLTELFKIFYCDTTITIVIDT